MNDIRVLVVEDEEFWQEILRDEFTGYKCKVTLARNYREAKEKLDEYSFDIVTLDMALSTVEQGLKVTVSGGWRLLANQLSKDSPGTFIFVISASFEKSPKEVFDLQQKYGVTDFMTKDDIDLKNLEEWVEYVRKFKEAGGRPDSSNDDLLKIYQEAGGRPDSSNDDLMNLYKEQLLVHEKNREYWKLQKAKHGSLNVPVDIQNSIDDATKEIEIIRTKLGYGSS